MTSKILSNPKLKTATKILLSRIGEPTSDHNISELERMVILTVNTFEGKEYIWYLDTDNKEAAYCLDTDEVLPDFNVEALGVK